MTGRRTELSMRVGGVSWVWDILTPARTARLNAAL